MAMADVPINEVIEALAARGIKLALADGAAPIEGTFEGSRFSVAVMAMGDIDDI